MQYDGTPDFFKPIPAGDPHITLSEKPSGLLSASDYEEIVKEMITTLDRMPQFGYPPDLLASEALKKAHTGLGVLMELKKFTPMPAFVTDAKHTQYKRRFEAIIAKGAWVP